MEKTERWGLRFNYWRYRHPDRGGPAIKLHWGYWSEGQMPHAPLEFIALPQHVKDHFNCDEKGFLPSSTDWKEFCSQSQDWNREGVYDSIDLTVNIRV